MRRTLLALLIAALTVGACNGPILSNSAAAPGAPIVKATPLAPRNDPSRSASRATMRRTIDSPNGGTSLAILQRWMVRASLATRR